MSERLTLVVFKDHLSSRTLTVRLAWLRAFGLALLSVIGLAIVAAALFLNAYRKTISSGSVANAARVEELEKEAAEAKAAYESLKSQALGSVAGASPVLAGGTHSFTFLPPESVLEKLPAAESLSFRLEPIKAQWKGSTLHIRSAIEYSKEDGGNQQGHFLILARGPQAIAAYPDSVFNPGGSPSLIKPEAAEFFSVSRYREIKADLGPFAKRDDVQTIEIFIFDPAKRLIFVNRIGLDSAKAAAPAEETVPAPKPKKALPKSAPPESPVESVAPENPGTTAPDAAPAEGGT